MGLSLVEKIFTKKSTAGRPVAASENVDVFVDCRCARDFGGANVVKNIQDNGLAINDTSKTFFTFDCNPGGSDQKYAQNQQICRLFARERGIRVYDIDQGIGTHLAIDSGLVKPGEIFVSTDSHANILGAIGAFGQGMGDIDIAATWAHGSCWFKVPKSMKVVLKGIPKNPLVSAKDVTFALLKEFGANGLLGHCAELYGDFVEKMTLSDRITVSSMGTEMGAIAILFTPNAAVLEELGLPKDFDVTTADEDAKYTRVVEVNIENLEPHVARPGHPDDVVPVTEVKGKKVDSCFIGSCTNGRYQDFVAAARIFEKHHVAPGVVCKIVPSTRFVWERLLKEGLVETFMQAGCLVGNSGCAGCAAGQIGQNGPKEVTLSTGNRNFPGKQGKGFVYLASPATVAATAVAGHITTADDLPVAPSVFEKTEAQAGAAAAKSACLSSAPPMNANGRAWVIPVDNIDTDMIFHNRYLHITNIDEMGQYAFDNLDGWKDFAKKVQKGDIIVTGKNFGCGSSRQQAVDCFKALGVSAIVAESFGAIYERNAINAGFPILNIEGADKKVKDGQIITVDYGAGTVTYGSEVIKGEPFSAAQKQIYNRGGLLCKAVEW